MEEVVGEKYLGRLFANRDMELDYAMEVGREEGHTREKVVVPVEHHTGRCKVVDAIDAMAGDPRVAHKNRSAAS